MKKPVDYLYLKCNVDKSKKFCVHEHQVAGINVLEVHSAIPNTCEGQESRLQARKFHRWKRKLHRVLSSYEISSCAINGDEWVLQALQIENPGFLARKNELFLYGTYILEHLAFRKMDGGREKLLIYLESENWKSQEIRDLLWMAKDYYEDIVLASQDVLAYEDVMTQIFEDCGLVVTTVDLKSVQRQAYDGVFFFVKKWNDSYMERVSFRRAYAVAEYEGGGTLCRKAAGRAVAKQPVCFSGLCYACSGKKIPYSLAVDLYFQTPVFCEKKDISFVAIYRLECYNNNNSVL